jgi:hypothetical protein
METPPTVDVVAITSTASGVAPSDLVVAIATLHTAAATSASRERVVGAVTAVGAPASTVVGANSLVVAAAVVAPAGTATVTVTGHPPTDLLFLVASMSAPIGPVAGAAGPLDVAAVVGAPAGTASGVAGPWATVAVVGAPAWSSFDPSMGGAPYCSTSHTFTAP